MSHLGNHSAACCLGLVSLWAAGCSAEPEPELGELIILISVDTLRADRLGAWGSEAGLTPAMDQLAQAGVVFERAFAPAAFTLPSVSALLTGLNPEQTGIATNEYTLDAKAPTLAALLKERGFVTGAVVANWVLRRATGLDRGFDVYDDHFGTFEVGREVPEQTADTTTTDALALCDLLSQRAGPGGKRFLWVHYQDPHGPYTPPAEIFNPLLERELARPDAQRELEAGRDQSGLGTIPAYQLLGDERRIGYYRAAYDAEVRYLDREVGRLLDGLRERGLFELATIVLCADHGEGLGENDYWFAHGEYLSDPLVHVPLIVKGSAGGPRYPDGQHIRNSSRRSDLAGLVDVLPTLCAAAGGLKLPNGLAGRDLFATRPLPSRALVLATLGASTRPRFGYLFENEQLLVTLDPTGKPSEVQVFESPATTAGSDGAAERTNLAAEDPASAARLLGAMARARQTLAAPRFESQALEPTEAELENLRKLGYVK